MVKRKADKSLKKWLGESEAIPARSQVGTRAHEEEQTLPIVTSVDVGQFVATPATEAGQFTPSLATGVDQSTPLSTVEVAHTEVPAVTVATPLTDVDTTESEAANWFWTLLEPSGYERW